MKAHLCFGGTCGYGCVMDGRYIHEGEPVGPGCQKLIIRTDVVCMYIYDCAHLTWYI